MEILKLTIFMFTLTLCIGLVVAFIIKFAVRGVEYSQIIRNEKYHQEMSRLRNIRRIRNQRNTKRLRKIEEATENKILNFYYGQSNRNKNSTSENYTNELIEHFYGHN